MSEYRSKRQADPTRLLAIEVINDVEDKGAFANLILPKKLRQASQQNPNFTFRDAAFVSELVYGLIRQRAYLDTVLQHFCTRPLDQLDPIVLQIMRLGAYQLLFMRVPDHAAVAETVDIARKLTSDGPTKMVNAVLRSITRASEEDISAIFSKISDSDNQIAARSSHPRWIVDSFRQALLQRGIREDELQAALDANNLVPKVNLVARPGLIDPSTLASEAEEVLDRPVSQGQISEYAVILDGGDPGALPSLRQGDSAVQDEGSQLAALILANAEIPSKVRPTEYWLDLCAGPGGKTALLAAIASKDGNKVIANEISEHRSRLVERSVRALNNVDVLTKDGRSLDFSSVNHLVPAEFEGFDRVLVDAPCTGLGSLRRRPESRWRHSPEDVKELVPLQRELLMNGISLTRPGGLFAWVTCTPQVEETLEQIEYAIVSEKVRLLDATEIAQNHAVMDLQQGQPTSFNPVWENLTSVRKEIVNKTVQLWPHRHGTDAMFIALMERL